MHIWILNGFGSSSTAGHTCMQLPMCAHFSCCCTVASVAYSACVVGKHMRLLYHTICRKYITPILSSTHFRSCFFYLIHTSLAFCTWMMHVVVVVEDDAIWEFANNILFNEHGLPLDSEALSIKSVTISSNLCSKINFLWRGVLFLWNLNVFAVVTKGIYTHHLPEEWCYCWCWKCKIWISMSSSSDHPRAQRHLQTQSSSP